MTNYYVGSGGNNGNAGTSWAQRKLTLNGAEDIPVAAGDVVYVGPGTYRELLTVDVSGSGGSPITYIGDYTGANTDGTGGVVRITGSDNDQTATRANCISATSKNYRTFQGFQMDMTTGSIIVGATSTNWTIEKCYFSDAASQGISCSGATQAAWTIQNCMFFPHKTNTQPIVFSHTVAVDNAGHTVQNCIFQGGVADGILFTRVGGNTIKNCVVLGHGNGIRVSAALTVGQTITVNNCLLAYNTTAFIATATGEITEDYNALWGNSTDRTNTNTGANSNAFPALFDTRWFFQLVNEGAGPNSVTQVITPWDLSSLSQLLNVAGTSPTTTDMRGTAVQSTQREWGALEYDSTLKIEGGGGGGSIFGGAVVR